MTLPVGDPGFWRGRILELAARSPELHKVIWHTELPNWDWVQKETARILKEHLSTGDKLLDAGCGYGAASECLGSLEVVYVGVDLSPDLIAIGMMKYPNHKFIVADLSVTQLPYTEAYFDLALMRAIKGNISGNCGQEVWDAVLDEIRRVSKKTLLVSYPDEPGETAYFEIEQVF